MARRLAKYPPVSLSSQGSEDQKRSAAHRSRNASRGLCTRGPDCRSVSAWPLHNRWRQHAYPLNTRLFIDVKRGTPNPVMARDTDVGRVRLRAFVIYSKRFSERHAFIKEIR